MSRNMAWTAEHIKTLTQALMSIPRLTSLRIDYSHFNVVPFYQLLHHITSQLVSLQIDGYPLESDSLQVLCWKLQSNSMLAELTLGICSDHANQSIQPIFQLLGSLPQLKNIVVSDSPKMVSQNGSVRCLAKELREFLKANRHLVLIQLWLESTPETNWYPVSLRQVPKALKTNGRCLQTLVIGAEEDSVPKSVTKEDLDETDRTQEPEEESLISPSRP